MCRNPTVRTAPLSSISFREPAWSPGPIYSLLSLGNSPTTGFQMLIHEESYQFLRTWSLRPMLFQNAARSAPPAESPRGLFSGRFLSLLRSQSQIPGGSRVTQDLPPQTHPTLRKADDFCNQHRDALVAKHQPNSIYKQITIPNTTWEKECFINCCSNTASSWTRATIGQQPSVKCSAM